MKDPESRRLDNILILEAGTNHAMLAIYREGELVDCQVTSSQDGALGLIHLLLQRADLNLLSWDAILVGSGPGSYTGLRVALATAGGMALAWAVPLILVSSLSCFILPDETCVACLDARAGGVYAQLYVHGKMAGMPQRLSDQEARSPWSFLEPRLSGLLPTRFRNADEISWVGPHASVLSQRLGSLERWCQREPYPWGMREQALAGYGKTYYPPFHHLRLDYLKEDYEVVRGV